MMMKCDYYLPHCFYLFVCWKDLHGKIDAEQVKDVISEVLQNIQTEKYMYEGKIPKADLWCHFGHMYVSNIDEGTKYLYWCSFE